MKLMHCVITDTSHGLFVRTLYLVCHNLISNWRNDTQFSLTALEVLTSLARIKLPDTNDSTLLTATLVEGKKCIKWICDYIVNQCSRPPPCHSKDMHSTIVAAFQCLTVWFQEHPSLLNDKDCVTTLLEVIELGISGSKSKAASGLTLKDKKELKPASMRVREAAESLMSCLMNYFGSLPAFTFLPEDMMGCNLMDEPSLLKSCKVVNGLTQTEDAVKYFRYFVNDNSILFSIMKEAESSHSIFIIRSPFAEVGAR